jgi:hypothetical protein
VDDVVGEVCPGAVEEEEELFRRDHPRLCDADVAACILYADRHRPHWLRKFE